MLDAGIAVAAGTDAPFGHPDPWRVIAAARDRETPSGVVLGPAERIPAARALALFLAPLTDPGGTARRLELGAPADLCVLDRPLDAALRHPAEAQVVATVARGALTFTA